MTCRDVNDSLCAGAGGADVESHLVSCEACRRLASALRVEPRAVNTAMIDRVRTEVLADIAPVQPMPSRTVLALVFFAIFAGTAAAGGWLLRMFGLRAMTPVERTAILALLLLTALAASSLCAAEMIPGSA